MKVIPQEDWIYFMFEKIQKIGRIDVPDAYQKEQSEHHRDEEDNMLGKWKESSEYRLIYRDNPALDRKPTDEHRPISHVSLQTYTRPNKQEHHAI